MDHEPHAERTVFACHPTRGTSHRLARHLRRWRTRGCIVGVAALVTGVAPGTTVGQSAPDWAAIAELIVQRLDVQAGARVMLLGDPDAGIDVAALVEAFRAEVREAGAEDLGALSVTDLAMPGEPTEFVRAARAAGSDREALRRLHRSVDVAINLPGANAADPAYAAMQDVLREGRGRTVHFHWAGAYSLNGDELPVDARVASLYERVILDTDYTGLARRQRAFERAMRGSEVRVTTPAGTDLRFRIGDRPVTHQDGDVSGARMETARNLIDREIEFPAGAVRVAPIETSVQGTIAFPPSTWGSTRVEGLRLRLEAGRVVEATAASGLGAAEAEMDAAGPSGRAFREFALGLNPLLAIPEDDPFIPHYGYGAGVVRLSLGDNTELGGDVGGGYVRWNFFPDATVTVGDEVWVQDGRLVRR